MSIFFYTLVNIILRINLVTLGKKSSHLGNNLPYYFPILPRWISWLGFGAKAWPNFDKSMLRIYI